MDTDRGFAAASGQSGKIAGQREQVQVRQGAPANGASGQPIERRSGRPRSRRPTAPEFAIHGLQCAEAVVLILAGILSWYALPELASITRSALTSIVLSGPLTVLFGARLGAYRDDQVFAARPLLRRQLTAWATTITGLILLAFALGWFAEYPRLWVLLWFGGGAVALSAVRLIFFYGTRQWVRQGSIAQRAVIVGTGAHGRRLAEHLTASGDSRVRVVGVVEDTESARHPAYIGPHRVVGGLARLNEMIRNNEVDQVVIALSWSERDRILGLVARLAELPVHIRLAPELLRFEFPERRCDLVGDIPLLRVLDRPVSGRAEWMKAIEDRVLGSMLLLACFPVMLLVALSIRLDSPGPIFFRQTRHGFNNNLIRVWKFRTMHHHLTDSVGAVLTQRGDPRVTRVGRLLRRTSLDELPQLFNVITGEMSLVGPRPHALEAKAGDTLYQEVMANYAARHRVKPGITGWAQVNGWRGETDTHDKLIQRVNHDLYYIDNWSLWLDLRILLRTVLAVINSRNAF